MDLPVFPADGGIEGLGEFNPVLPKVFDATMLSDFVNCPSLFYLRHVLGLRHRSKEEKNDLNWGKVWHRAQELYWGTSPESVVEAFEGWPVGLDFSDPKNRTLERMALCITEYFERFSYNLAKAKHVRSEQYFEVHCPENNPDCRFGGCGLSWCGRIDRMVERRGKLLVWDYKTTGRYVNDDFFESYKNSFQIPGYVWAANHITTETVNDAVLDVFRCIKTQHEFYQRTFSYTDERILEWLYNTKYWVAQVHSMYERWKNEPEKWPKNWAECTRYYRCAFAAVHFTPPTRDDRTRVLAADYEEHRWDPQHIVD